MPFNHAALMVILAQLEVSGAQVHTTDNGVQALEQVKALGGKENYNIIFMDLNMPFMDGNTATSQIRSFFTAKDMP